MCTLCRMPPGEQKSASRPAHVILRPTLQVDVAALFEIQLDPAGCELAGVMPRDLATFEGRWSEILDQDRNGTSPSARITPRVIIADGLLVGSINIVPEGGAHWLGYWIAREHWGRGIATRAIALMTEEFTPRPLHARVAAHNTASLRALASNGFIVAQRIDVPQDARHHPGERFILVRAD